MASPGIDKFFKLVNSPWRFRLFLLAKLPAALFSGVRVKHADEHSCSTVVPYRWSSKNPFNSTYFACLSMAAEMSTGVLAMAHSNDMPKPISMLVVGVESTYHKKAKGITTFTCNDGLELRKAILHTIETKEPVTYKSSSNGVNAKGETVAKFFVTWSFKSQPAG